LTIDTHHHLLPDFFWQETENAHAPVGGLAPLRWSKEASISFMDEAGIDMAVVSLSTPGVHTGDSAKAQAVKSRQRLETDALNDAERAAVLGGTASSLFPRPKSVLATSEAASRRSPDTAR